MDLSDVRIRDAGGTPSRIGDLIDRPTIIDLVRYYGCAPCRVHLGQLSRHFDEVRDMGGEIIAVGPAAPYQVDLLVRSGVPFRMYLDPERELAAGIDLGRKSLIGFIADLRGWARWVLSLFRGGRQGAITAGWAELPAVIVVDAASRVRWVHRGRFLGDYPPIERTVDELRRAVDSAAEEL